MTNSYLDQRYYHVVVMGPAVPWHLENLWKAIPGIAAGRADETGGKSLIVQHRTIKTDNFPGRGEPGPNIATTDGHYLLDIFGLETTIGRQRFVALGVPYIELGRRLVFDLRESGLLRQVEFLKVNLTDLVEAIRAQRAEVAGLGLSKIAARVDNDPDVTGFSISGEGAIFSGLYQTVWQKVGFNSVVRRCILRYLEDSNGLSFTCDGFGNFRLWVRKGASNVALFRAGLELLITSGTTFSDAAIPYFRASESEGED